MNKNMNRIYHKIFHNFKLLYLHLVVCISILHKQSGTSRGLDLFQICTEAPRMDHAHWKIFNFLRLGSNVFLESIGKKSVKYELTATFLSINDYYYYYFIWD